MVQRKPGSVQSEHCFLVEFTKAMILFGELFMPWFLPCMQAKDSIPRSKVRLDEGLLPSSLYSSMCAVFTPLFEKSIPLIPVSGSGKRQHLTFESTPG